MKTKLFKKRLKELTNIIKCLDVEPEVCASCEYIINEISYLLEEVREASSKYSNKRNE